MGEVGEALAHTRKGEGGSDSTQVRATVHSNGTDLCGAQGQSPTPCLPVCAAEQVTEQHVVHPPKNKVIGA